MKVNILLQNRMIMDKKEGDLSIKHLNVELNLSSSQTSNCQIIMFQLFSAQNAYFYPTFWQNIQLASMTEG